MKTVSGTARVRAAFKRIPEDFVVEEILPFSLSGSGSHNYVFVEKKGISTFEAADLLASACGCSPRDIGYAGLKDKTAVARQYFSLPCETPKLSDQRIRILSSTRHQTKLKIGKLYANRFTILLREVSNPDALAKSFSRLSSLGVPNYFGEQRFGAIGKNHEIGRALLLGDLEKALDLFLLAKGSQEALARRLLVQFSSAKQVWRRMPRRITGLMLNSLQSELFNDVLDRRIGSFDKLLEGDLAMVGNKFTTVSDPSEFSDRLAAFEVSPSGPLFGRKVKLAEGLPGEIERAVLSENKLPLESFSSSTFRLDGYRRPLRLQLIEPSIAISGSTATLSFALKKGGYATAVIFQLIEKLI